MFALLIDDDTHIRRALSDEIREQGDHHRVLQTDCGAQASETLRQLRPEVLLLDLSCAGLVELQSYQLTPPAVVILSATDQESVRALRQAGLSAWMKPEVFSHLPEILRWAERVQTQPDCLCEQWDLILVHLGCRSSKSSPRVLALSSRGGQTLIEGREILAAAGTGGQTRIVLADRIADSPHGLSFLARQLRGCGLVLIGNRLLVSRLHPGRVLAAALKLTLGKLLPASGGVSPNLP